MLDVCVCVFVMIGMETSGAGSMVDVHNLRASCPSSFLFVLVLS